MRKTSAASANLAAWRRAYLPAPHSKQSTEHNLRKRFFATANLAKWRRAHLSTADSNNGTENNLRKTSAAPANLRSGAEFTYQLHISRMIPKHFADKIVYQMVIPKN
jgi:hypothetical protein